MIEVYAMLFFTMYLRQSTASTPPTSLNDWAYFVIGVLISILIGGGVLTAWLKNWTDNQEFKRKEAEARLTQANEEAHARLVRDSEQSKADTFQDTAISQALTKIADVAQSAINNSAKVAATAEERNKLQARTADVMVINTEAIEALGDRVKKMTAEIVEGRDEIVSKVSQKLSEPLTEHTTTLRAIREDINTLNTQSLVEVKDQLTTIMARLEELQGLLAKTVTSDFLKGEISELHDELKVVTGNVESLAANIEKMLVAPEAKSKADGPALAATSMAAPTGEPKESEKPQ